MAVELAKVSLWLEALDPGKPLSFLDAHIKQGNALIGATPKLIDGGIPAGAFKPIEGDDPKFAKSLERANAAQPVLTAGQRRVARFSASTHPAGLGAAVVPGGAVQRRDHLLPVQRGPRRRPGQDRPPAGRLAARGPLAGRRLPGLGRVGREPGQAPDRRRLVRCLRVAQARRRAPRDREPSLHRTEGEGPQLRSRRPLRPRSSGCERNTASSTGTWSSPTSSASPTAAERTSTRAPAGSAASRSSSATRRGTG